MTSRTHLAESLRRARKGAGISMKDAGAAVGRSLKTVSAWESGQNEPSPEMLMALCRVYGVPISFFFPPELSGFEYAVVRLPDKLEDELIENYRASSPKGRAQIIEYAAMVAERHPKSEADKAAGQTA